MTREETLDLAKRAVAGDAEALERLRGKGGRPRKLTAEALARARELRATGMGWKEIADVLNVHLATLGRERRREAVAQRREEEAGT